MNTAAALVGVMLFINLVAIVLLVWGHNTNNNRLALKGVGAGVALLVFEGLLVTDNLPSRALVESGAWVLFGLSLLVLMGWCFATVGYTRAELEEKAPEMNKLLVYGIAAAVFTGSSLFILINVK